MLKRSPGYKSGKNPNRHRYRHPLSIPNIEKSQTQNGNKNNGQHLYDNKLLPPYIIFVEYNKNQDNISSILIDKKLLNQIIFSFQNIKFWGLKFPRKAPKDTHFSFDG